MRGIDYVLLLAVVALVCFGLLMVYSASFIFAHERTGDGYLFIKKQLLFACAGGVALLFAAKLHYQKWREWSVPIFFGSLALLVLVLIPGVGSRVGGAQRWLSLGFFQLQPAEILKFATVLFVSHQLVRKSERLHTFRAGVLGQLLIPGIGLVLLMLQPDFGSTVILSFVMFALLFLAGVRIRHLIVLCVPALCLGAFLIFTSQYRLNRFMTFLDPWKDPSGKGFQVLQSLVGLHNGRWIGQGLGNSKEKLFYLPEAHNDFILAVIGEELGWLGIALTIAVFCVVLFRGLRIGWQSYQSRGDSFSLYLATGITLLLGFQAFVNMAVVMGLVPTKGLTLPFVSYGGSALIVNLFLIGILLSISRGTLHGASQAKQ